VDKSRPLAEACQGSPALASPIWWTLIAAAIAILASLIAVKAGPPLVGCNIKGNISYNTGERIYHVPGQQYYNETRISLWKGERWFCSEQEARKAGWRKSRL